MLRVGVALLLIAAALAAVDLSDLVDAVYTNPSPLEQLTPTYVVEVNGCVAPVYVVDSPSDIPRMYNVTYFSTYKKLRPLTSAEVEKLLDALFQVLGPSAKAEVTVDEGGPLWFKDLPIEARNAAQLAEEARRAVEADFYLGAADAYEALERGARRVAYLSLVKWWRGDLGAVFLQRHSSAHLMVLAANLSAAVEALKKAKETVGEVWNHVSVVLEQGPYIVPDDVREALGEAAQRLEKELRTVQEIRDERGWVRRVKGTILVFTVGKVGPVYVVFPYPNGTAPDRATAERLVRRFVELSGFCESPLVVEFWPKTEFEPMLPVGLPPLWPYAAAVGAALAVAVVLLVLTRRRK